MIYDESAAQGSTENREAEQPTVLVGYDGSKPAEAALRWAVQEASRRQAVLRVLTAYDPYPLSGWSVVDPDEWRVTATEQAADAAELVAELSGGTVDAEARRRICAAARCLVPRPRVDTSAWLRRRLPSASVASMVGTTGHIATLRPRGTG